MFTPKFQNQMAAACAAILSAAIFVTVSVGPATETAGLFI